MKKYFIPVIMLTLIVSLTTAGMVRAYPTKNIFNMNYSSYLDEYSTGWNEVGDNHSFLQSVYPGRNNSEGTSNTTEHTFQIDEDYYPDENSHHYRIIYSKEYFDMGTQAIYNPYAGPPNYMLSPDDIYIIDGDSGHSWASIYGVDEGERGYIAVWDDVDVDDYGHLTIDIEWDDGYFWWEETPYDSNIWHQASGRNSYFGGFTPAIDYGYDFAVVDGFSVY